MIYQVKYTNEAHKDIKKNPDKDKNKIIEAIKIIIKNPLAGKPLQAYYKGKYSFRVGNIRIIYTVDLKDKLIIVLKIKHRKEAYRF